MPKRKDYPKWFSYTCPPIRPCKPNPPPETVDDDRCLKIGSDDIRLSDLFEFAEQAAGVPISLNDVNILVDTYPAEDSYADPDIDIQLRIRIGKKPNPNLAKQLKYYKLDLKRYETAYLRWKEKSAEWKKLKKKWDAETEAEIEKRELKLFKRLKKKFNS